VPRGDGRRDRQTRHRDPIIRQLDETQSAVTEASLLRPRSCRLVDGDRATGKGEEQVHSLAVLLLDVAGL
jgi:hypothetical protein